METEWRFPIAGKQGIKIMLVSILGDAVGYGLPVTRQGGDGDANGQSRSDLKAPPLIDF